MKRLARRMFKYLEDSAGTKVSTRELEEQLLSTNESRVNVAHRKASQEREGRKVRQREGEVLVASKARWDVQLKGLVELERRCQSFRADVEYYVKDKKS